MSEQAKDGIYVYQPFGMQHPDKWKSGRIYGIGGLPMEATIHGLTKAEADAIRDALVAVVDVPDQPSQAKRTVDG